MFPVGFRAMRASNRVVEAPQALSVFSHAMIAFLTVPTVMLISESLQKGATGPHTMAG